MTTTSLTTFSFNTNTLRVVEISGAPWFVAADVCRVLGIKNTSHALSKLGSDEQTLVQNDTQKSRQAPYWKAVSESGLYKLIMRSDKPVARSFQDWVTRDVLPAIRKDGAYVIGEEKVSAGEMTEDELVLQVVAILQKKVARLAAERDNLKVEVEQHLRFVTVDEWRALNHLYLVHADRVRMGQTASSLCRQRQIEIRKQQRTVHTQVGPRTAVVHEYPFEILEEVAQFVLAA